MSEAPFRSGFVAFLGAPNVGKSTLLNALVHEKISITCHKPQTTRNRVTGIVSGLGHQVVLVDTPGVFRADSEFNRILVDTALATLAEVDAICYMIEAPAPNRDIDRFVFEHLEHVNTPVILVINKIDLIRKSELLPVIDAYRQKRDFAAVIPVSALKNDGVEDLTAEMVNLIPEHPPYYPEDYFTDQPERFIVAEIVREKVFHLTQEEIPYAVAVEVELFEEQPDTGTIRIETTIHVEKQSQKAILIGKGGSMLKEIGKQARRDIQHLLGCKVYLGLFVHVQKNWRKDPRALRRFGYHN